MARLWLALLTVVSAECPGGRPPNVALCLAGAARTFSYDSVYGRLRKNFVDAYGANITTVRTSVTRLELLINASHAHV